MQPGPLRTALVAIAGTFGVSFGITAAALGLSVLTNYTPLVTIASTTAAVVASLDPPRTATSSSTTNQVGTSSGIQAPAAYTANLIYTFNTTGVLQEAATAPMSTSPYWFLDSGGELLQQNGIGETIQGALPQGARWQLAYAANNPTDTDNGYHPQNIFRLVTRQTWTNLTSEAWFLVANDNLSESPNRNASNGLLLMSRYLDHNNLYYAGIRVDGTAIIKKKYAGTYYTLAQVPIFSGTYGTQNSNLLPHQTWLGLRDTVTTNANGSVTINLYLANGDNAPWVLIASATDDGTFGNTLPITAAGSFGIRTDFMDVQFKNVRVSAT